MIIGIWIVCIMVFNLGAFGRCIGITFVDSKHIVSLITSQRHCKDTASKTQNSCHYSKGKTTSFNLLLLPSLNGMGRWRIHAAFILYKTLGYPELGYILST